MDRPWKKGACHVAPLSAGSTKAHNGACWRRVPCLSAWEGKAAQFDFLHLPWTPVAFSTACPVLPGWKWHLLLDTVCSDFQSHSTGQSFGIGTGWGLCLMALGTQWY